VLHVAATLGRVEIARLLIEHGADVDARDRERDTALLAVLRRWGERRELDAVRALLEAGADPNARRGKLDAPALHLAVTADDPELLECLLAAGADPNGVAVDRGWRHAALHIATSARVVRMLLEAGADPNLEDGGHPIAHHLAAPSSAEERRKRIALLLEHGSVVDRHPDWCGLGLAVSTGDPLLVDLPLRAGADANCENRGMTPLYLALGEDTTILERLLAAGADPNQGFTFEAAVREGFQAAVEKLLAAGADANKQDELGLRPLDHATNPAIADLLRPLTGRFRQRSRPAARGAVRRFWRPQRPATSPPSRRASRRVTTRVLRRGARRRRRSMPRQPRRSSGVCSRRERTSLPGIVGASRRCIRRSYGSRTDEPARALACVDALIAHGAPLDPVDSTLALSPLEFAIRCGSAEATEYLLRAGADPNATKLDETPLERVARLAGDAPFLRIFELLIRHGADVSRKLASGGTILHVLAELPSPAAVMIARKAGASTTIRDEAGFLPRDYAASAEVMAALDGPVE
jgi:ankyrin repeat protein